MLLRFPLWKVILIVTTLVVGAIMCVPNFAGYIPKPVLDLVPTGPMKLGLDLQGGASILLEVDPVELRENKLKRLNTEVRTALTQRPQIPNSNRRVENGQLLVPLRNPADAPEAIKRIKKLGEPGLGQTGPNLYDVVDRGGGLLVVTITEEGMRKLESDAIANSRESVQRRVDGSGLVEPNIQREGANRIIVEVPGIDEAKAGQLVNVLTQAGVLSFQLVDETANPADYTLNLSRNGKTLLPSAEEGGQPLVVFDEQPVTGEHITNAQRSTDQFGRPDISFTLNAQGGAAFGKITAANIGKQFAIILDGHIVSAPQIQGVIPGGSGQITGNFSVAEAENLAVVLRSGALPAKLKVVDRRVVSASLGEDSIKAGVGATVVGIGLVAVFMLAAYGLLGVFALIALGANIMLLIGVLSGFGATLTLPGIAGILLTVGMAVDANVLIFERIREEKKNGVSAIRSVELGYDQAMATIIDANATHFLAGIVMFNLGSGPIKGFALTLVIGILTSLFTAVVVARWIMAIWLKLAKPKHIPI